ncbi:MAG: hypothetical protein A2939_05785 [Parcubacteria group bacterium RIFCSPLOWO2_01_FULL_48_18]|nr:MAG: hypothetical protein A2939_05785 [Parcubacteria group bacterium RIFCSPLOWO2_01_FULL_48_18]OHB22581.1 MAG: hypothetical protein A3J67_00770 [Parcubacteria group bacterium RIFCSPHIGHO2_02_FULL_48_10b]
MTVALILYFFAFGIARKYWILHVIAALVGFGLDLYATYLMTVIEMGPSSWKLITHTGFSVVAIAWFFVQGGLGLVARTASSISTRKRARQLHVRCAKWFLAIWIIAFFSGALLFVH